MGTKGRRASQVAPLAFSDASLKAMHQAIMSRQSFQVKSPSGLFSSPVSELPAELFPTVLGPIHESRLMDRLPTLPMSAPSLEFIRHTGYANSNVPTVVAEGQPKPELSFTIDHVTAVAQKVACHIAVTWESLSDVQDWMGYVSGDVFRKVQDTENSELLNGSGAGHVQGFLATPNILTHDASVDNGTLETALDSVEISIAKLRTGPSLAEPDLFICHPETWSAMRRIKNTLGSWLVQPDPTKGQVNTLWGVPVLVTIACNQRTGILLDTTKFGHVLVREALTMRTGADAGDVISNLVRLVVEERFTLAVERPSAVLAISNLPTVSGS